MSPPVGSFHRLGRALASACLLLGLACGRSIIPSAAPARPPAPAPVAERVDAAALDLLREAGVEGTFVLRSLDNSEQIVADPALAGVPEVPASTFKIPHALIALQLEVLSGADAVLKWDGRPSTVTPAWDRDHTLATAIRDSVVWYFQETARRIGPGAMQRSLDAMRYGNREIAGPVDRFWLEGPLKISPREQVDFMTRLRRRELPIARRHMEAVELMMIRAQGVGWTWRGKTGLAQVGGVAIGWLVGLVDRDGRSWAYALLVRAPVSETERIMPLRIELTRALLTRYGALPEQLR